MPEDRRVGAALDGVLELNAALAEERGVRLHRDGAGGVVRADADELQRALLNLVSNAIEAMPDGGDLHARVESADGRVTIEIRDTGTGIPDDVIDRLFEPFAVPIALFVMIAQLAIGVAFVTARHLRPALWMGVTLNVVFVAIGAVDPSVFYLVIQLSLLAAVALGVFGGRPRAPNPVSVGLKLGVAGALAPYAMTIAPADVIHDPAIILMTVAILAAKYLP